jgi:hypothetical protein
MDRTKSRRKSGTFIERAEIREKRALEGIHDPTRKYKAGSGFAYAGVSQEGAGRRRIHNLLAKSGLGRHRRG